MSSSAKTRRPTRSFLLASASAAALFATPAAAQLVSYDFTTAPGSVTAPNTAGGAAIGNLASQINSALSATAVITGGSGVTTTPGTGAVSATNTLTSNTIAAAVSGNVSGPATGLSTFVDLSAMDASGGGSAAGTVFQSNSGPNILAGIGVSTTGVSDTLGATVAATFAGALNSTATLSGNTIGSTAAGNQANTLVGGDTPGAGVATPTGGTQIVIGAETVRQRTNTVDFDAYRAPAVTASATGVAGGTGTSATAFGVDASGTTAGALVGEYHDGGSANVTIPAYTDNSYAAGREIDLTGVVVASTAQQNTGLTTGATIQAITDIGSVAATLSGGASGGSLGMAGNSILSAATGNTAATGLAVTGGAPTVAGGLGVLNGQLNSSSAAGGAGAAGISALTETGSVTATLGGTTSASTLTLDANAIGATATGNTATNTLSVATTVHANSGSGAGTGAVSTGVVLAEERTRYTESVAAGDPLAGSNTLTTTGYSAVTADSSGISPSYNSLSVAADYAAVNVQRNRGADTAPLSIVGTLRDATVSIGGATATTVTTTSNSTLSIADSQLTAAATGSTATTVVGNGGMLLGDQATVAGLNLQEAVNTTVQANNSGAGIGVSLYRDTAAAVVTGGSLDVSTNTVGSTAQVNAATTQLTNLAADGTTLAATTGLGVNVRSTTATAPENLDVSYGATRFAAVSAQRIGTTDTTVGSAALILGEASTSNTTISAALTQGAAAGPFTAAAGTTTALEGNVISAAVGGNASTVGMSFASGSGSTIPGGALAGTAQIIAPTVDGASLQASVSSATVAVSALGTDAGPTTNAGLFDGGSVTVAGNTTSARVIGNQGSATITGALELIAGGSNAAGASATLSSSVVAAAAGTAASSSAGSYVVSNVQRTQPTDDGAPSTLGITATTANAQFTALGGFDASTASVSGNVATSVAAANVFSGGLVDLRPAGSATQLAASQQDVASTTVTASLTGSVFGVSTGRAAGTWDAVTGTSGDLTGAAVTVSGNTARAFAVMNEGSLSASGATLTDLSAAGTGAVVDASATGGAGSVLSLSGATIGLAGQQAVALDTVNGRVGSASVGNTSAGIFGGTGAVSGSTLTVASNTVDARMVANAATQSLSGDYFGGGVGVMNSQDVTQTGATNGLSSSNTSTTIAINIAPPVAGAATSTAAVSGNTIGASTMVNDATQSFVASRTGSVGTSSGTGSLSLATGTGATPLNVQNADYLLGNVQTSNGVRASASTTGAQLAVLMPSSGVTSSLQGNRVYAEVMGNRLSSAQSTPFTTNAYTQTASYQANTNSSFNASVSGASVSLTGGGGSSAASTALLSGNTIGASAMGNVLRATVGAR
ncbi:beta strand repeat-containing protein [Falsiroseomonas selenitidurans]|uniref:Autotransporter domain-containing protein n=1 Tax=Falsiroseomonas selenitidurans TaxID=2716335 RepID=A0ABX1E933_9PROT|nr:hypothetical protein [Falsiroseomonas selenitidurans]NKC33396.1 hypothetical protein [Falsiroseomonas selenitidurans]